uniref:Golgi resident protein GCP60 n=1 Tax=Parascaris univalens TaxID=6257 RepID=A0A915CHT7_PARUN
MISVEESVDASNNNVILDEFALIERNYGLPLNELYKLALKYYREKEKNGELVVPYEKRLLFMAYAKQIRLGPYNDSADDSGWFDLVGNDRKNAWRELGDLSAAGAMSSFVSLLDSVCPPFRDFVGEHVHTQRKLVQSAEESQRVEAQPSILSVNDVERFETQRRQIQEALNQQTYHQFRAYAQQQFVGDPVQQEALIKQLQEQHYQQYMAQVYAQQAKVVGASPDGDKPMNADSVVSEVAPDSTTKDLNNKKAEESDVSDEEPGDDLPSNPAIAPASMWNRQDIVEFKNAIRKEGAEGIIKVGHGETVTVRVPTHEEGTCLFWEFATDYYDIGFGVLFEWTIAESNQVSVHISESSDEEADEELAQAELRASSTGDVESGSPTKERQRDPNKPHVDEIVPVYRRDCHEEVYAGSHVYPGRGVYLLKFDNSYSLWRSKTLYYRVYYSK